MTEDQLSHLTDKLGDLAGYSPPVMRSMLESALADMPKAEADRPTLRDQFAMAALTGFLAAEDYGPTQSYYTDDHAAERAYRIADAMMKERQG